MGEFFLLLRIIAKLHFLGTFKRSWDGPLSDGQCSFPWIYSPTPSFSGMFLIQKNQAPLVYFWHLLAFPGLSLSSAWATQMNSEHAKSSPTTLLLPFIGSTDVYCFSATFTRLVQSLITVDYSWWAFLFYSTYHPLLTVLPCHTPASWAPSYHAF